MILLKKMTKKNTYSMHRRYLKCALTFKINFSQLVSERLILHHIRQRIFANGCKSKLKFSAVERIAKMKKIKKRKVKGMLKEGKALSKKIKKEDIPLDKNGMPVLLKPYIS